MAGGCPAAKYFVGGRDCVLRWHQSTIVTAYNLTIVSWQHSPLPLALLTVAAVK